MKIKVRLFATFRDGRGKELEYQFSEGSTVLNVLEMIRIKQRNAAILLINGRDGKFDTLLSHGDTISLSPPVGGG
ncbi:MoaD/ThiS family protein [Petroclostridium sp. X23]|uniref:MoaD/ThiS family protein n=1 Tax=Petroclostridium sp. X23 TaxID=3045146 RepID=UPI0024AE86B0|nr:MoaD/ThiS family protein [Petroclostridium sp. X23]WHH58815.1 MoaD/ThiS family protein [Petroclostridium sp. X23]